VLGILFVVLHSCLTIRLSVHGLGDLQDLQLPLNIVIIIIFYAVFIGVDLALYIWVSTNSFPTVLEMRTSFWVQQLE